MKQITTYSDVYDSKLYILTNCSWEDAQEWFQKKVKKYMEDGDRDACMVHLGGRDFVIWIENFHPNIVNDFFIVFSFVIF